MTVVFKDNRNVVFDGMDRAIQKTLIEVGGEVENYAKGSAHQIPQVSSQWRYEVDEFGKKVEVGSHLEEAIYQEFGTGEFAENNEGGLSGKGRKGWWVYINGGGKKSSSAEFYMDYKTALGRMHKARKNGLDAHLSHGIKAKHTLRDAFRKSESKIDSIVTHNLRSIDE